MLASCTGRCAEQIRSIDWSATALGQPSGWPYILQSVLGTILRSASPKFVLWGGELTTFYNEAALSLLDDVGVSGIGIPYPMLRPHRWLLIREHVESALRGCERLKSEFEVPAAPGGTGLCSYFEISFTPLYGENREPAGVLVDVHDTTPVRRSAETLKLENQRLQRLFLEAPILMAYAVTPELRLQFVNRALARLAGDRPLEGLPVLEAIPELAEQGFGAILETVWRTGEPWAGENVAFKVRDPAWGVERQHYLDFSYQAVCDDDGQVIGILFAGSDVTERRLARLESDRLRHQLLHASRVNAMGTMAMTLAHELNQPLTAAANYVAASRKLLLTEGFEEDAPLVEALTSSSEQIIRAGEVIRRIRSVVRAGEADRRPVDLEQVLNRVTCLLDAGGALEITLTKRIADDAGYVMADEIQLEQVLVNLVRNAGQASRHSERKEVVISTERLANDVVRVRLRDFGCGLSPEHIEYLFDGVFPGETNGLGIGLSLSRTLIEANGGELRACNAEGGGAVFIFELAAGPSGAAES